MGKKREYLVEWWEEGNDCSTDFCEVVSATNSRTAIEFIEHSYPLARKVKATLAQL